MGFKFPQFMEKEHKSGLKFLKFFLKKYPDLEVENGQFAQISPLITILTVLNI